MNVLLKWKKKSNLDHLFLFYSELYHIRHFISAYPVLILFQFASFNSYFIQYVFLTHSIFERSLSWGIIARKLERAAFARLLRIHVTFKRLNPSRRCGHDGDFFLPATAAHTISHISGVMTAAMRQRRRFVPESHNVVITISLPPGEKAANDA